MCVSILNQGVFNNRSRAASEGEPTPCSCTGEENTSIVRKPVIASDRLEAEELVIDAAQAADRLHEGIVLRAISGSYIVQEETDKDSNPNRRTCTLRGNLKKTFTYSTSGSVPRRVIRAKRPLTTDTVSVGDRVRFLPMGEAGGIIEEILPRQSRFARASFRGREQTLITNLDQLAIVFACAEPNPDFWRIDRWIVAAEYHGLEPLIIANKRDLVDEATFQERFGEYERIGYRLLATCPKRGTGIDALRAALRGRISAFTGPSGVGKSSLLNVVQPGLQLATGEIGHITFKGRHTTTVRELIPLDTGGWVADTPGLRQLELLAMSREELAECFIEFRPLLSAPCRFHNCRHESEPGCCLKAGVEAGVVSQRRYESFLALAREIKEER
jgi:ribosome biogenesis GTPase